MSELTIFGSHNGLLPGRHQGIIWTKAGILLNWPLGTNFNEILSKSIYFHSQKCIWKCCLENSYFFQGLNELTLAQLQNCLSVYWSWLHFHIHCHGMGEQLSIKYTWWGHHMEMLSPLLAPLCEDNMCHLGFHSRRASSNYIWVISEFIVY